MKLHLDLNPEVSESRISHNDSILLCGSCFSTEIGNKLKDTAFKVVVNPHGILFNPLSIGRALERYIDEKPYELSDLTKHDGTWVSTDHHGSFSDHDSNTLLDKLNHANIVGAAALRNSDFLIITWGTAWYFELLSGHRPVGNCHRLPSSFFEKKLAATDVIYEYYKKLFEKIRSVNPRLKILLTISPVKYLRWGVTENNIGKASLFLACQRLMAEGFLYFPAFELVNDDLRDYRFYEDDMAHPNKKAVNYVWEKFLGTFTSIETRQLINEIEKFRLVEKHRPSDPVKHAEVIKTNRRKILQNYPVLDGIL